MRQYAEWEPSQLNASKGDNKERQVNLNQQEIRKVVRGMKLKLWMKDCMHSAVSLIFLVQPSKRPSSLYTHKQRKQINFSLSLQDKKCMLDTYHKGPKP